LPELQSEFNSVKDGLKEIRAELETHYRDAETGEGLKTCPDDRFYEVMQPFIEDAERRFEEVQEAMAEMSDSYKDCVKFYGENPAIMKPDEFFGIFKTFMSSFEVRLFFFGVI
jgi:cytokinesis protein